MGVGLALGGLAAPALALASPGLEGTRNLSMGNGARGSVSGSEAALLNPSAMSMFQQFELEPAYQLSLRDNTHGLGIIVGDSLNNPRFALALGYVFTNGSPRMYYTDPNGDRARLNLSHFGHEVIGVVSVNVIQRWWSIALKPKYQYTSLRYRDDDGTARDANFKLNAFGLDASTTLNIAGWVKLAVVGENLTGEHLPAWTEGGDQTYAGQDFVEGLEGIALLPGTEQDVNFSAVRRLSDYPRMLSHGLSVFPTNNPGFSLNFDGQYDFTSYKDENHLRLVYGGSGEFIAGPVPIRLGGFWDGRGPDAGDDRGYVTGGLGFIKPAQVGGGGVDIGVGFRQQVSGDQPLDTYIGVNIGLRLHPDL